MLLANVAIKGMDEKNRTLLIWPACARMLDGFMLTAPIWVKSTEVRSSLPAGLDSPFPLVRHNMLISIGLLGRNLRRGDALPCGRYGRAPRE